METKFNIKNFVKTQGNNGNKTVRLQSLKLPRDLSLGGTKPKKAYVPNLNVLRKKETPKEIIKRCDKRKDVNPPRNKPRKPNTNNQRYIQSSSIFSEGGGEIKRTLYRSERSINSKDNDTISSMIIPKINHNSWTVNKKAEDVVLDKLVICDEEKDDIKMNFVPRMLNNNLDFNKISDMQILLKKEKGATDETLAPFLGIHPSKIKKEEGCYLPMPFGNQKMYNDDNPAITIFKLPHSFAGKGLSDDPNVTTIFDYPLNAMLDGQIGKVCIRRSGKMEIHIGNIKYNLQDVSFLLGTSELVNFTTKGNEHINPGMTVLGNVNNWFGFVPQWQRLV